MNKTRWIGLFVALLCLHVSVSVAAETQFQESSVTLDGGIQGILTEPVLATSAKMPAVLLLHGFASQKDEVGDMYKRLAAALGTQGIASLRIDFRGWGESAGRMVESTVQGQVDDAAAAHNYLKTLGFIDPERIGAVGFSLGGGIAIVSAGQHPEWFASMVVWSSVGDFKPDFMFLGQENFDKAAREGQVTIDLGWREVTLGADFFTSLEQYDLQKKISAYPGAFLAISGSEDFSACYVAQYVSNAQGTPKDKLIIQGADHIFGVLGDDQSAANQVIDKTARWFKETLIAQD